MKQARSYYVMAIVQGMLAVLQILVPSVIFPVCQKEIEKLSGGTVPMKCHWFAVATIILGALLLVQAILKLFLKSRETRLYNGAVTLATGIATLICTSNCVIGVCTNAKMACRMGTLPAVCILGGATAFLGTLEILLNLKKEKA